jgi:hypothetical protein
MIKKRERLKLFLKILLIIVLLGLSLIIIITDYIRYSSRDKFYQGQINQLKISSEDNKLEIQYCNENEKQCDNYCCKADEECRDVLYKEDTIKYCMKDETKLCEDTDYPYYCSNNKRCYIGNCIDEQIEIMGP